MQSLQGAQHSEAGLEQDLEEYQALVRQIASQVAARLPRHVELDDLVSAGYLGLVEAARRYDPTRGVRFQAYVAERIRGAIIDHLRSLDWAPRSLRAAARRVEAARTSLTASLARTPTDEELAAETDMTAAQIHDVDQAVSASVVYALDKALGDDDEDDTDTVVAALTDCLPTPDDVLERKELSGYLADAIHCLPEQARTVVALYYVEGMQMTEIGEFLGVTQSRASQIHAAALTMLRETITAQLGEAAGVEVAQKGTTRATRRRAEMAEAVADASDWRSRIDGGHRNIPVDTATPLAELEARHAMSSEDFERMRRTGEPDRTLLDAADVRRWERLLSVTQTVEARRTRSEGPHRTG